MQNSCESNPRIAWIINRLTCKILYVLIKTEAVLCLNISLDHHHRLYIIDLTTFCIYFLIRALKFSNCITHFGQNRVSSRVWFYSRSLSAFGLSNIMWLKNFSQPFLQNLQLQMCFRPLFEVNVPFLLTRVSIRYLKYAYLDPRQLKQLLLFLRNEQTSSPLENSRWLLINLSIDWYRVFSSLTNVKFLVFLCFLQRSVARLHTASAGKWFATEKAVRPRFPCR